MRQQATYKTGSVAKEIDFLSGLSGFSCNDLKHFSVGAKILDPVDFPSQEGHLLTEEGSEAHLLFESLIAGEGIERKLDCGGENGLCYICPTPKAQLFEEMAAKAKAAMMWGILPVIKTILTFTIPDNAVYIVTFISLRTFPDYDEADLLLAGGKDYRADEFDIDGTTQAWLQINGRPIMPIVSVPYDFCNRPILEVFNAGEFLQFQVQRIGAIPFAMQVQVTLTGFLAPTVYHDKLKNLTRWTNTYTL